MPTISYFYGIVIMMHLRSKEHNPPHIHAIYGDYEATYFIESGDLYEGTFPKNGEKLVKQFIEVYKDRLMEMWITQNYEKLPPIM